MVISVSPELKSLFCAGQTRWVIAQIDTDIEKIVNKRHAEKHSESEQEAFEVMRQAIDELGITDCYVLFRRDDGRVSLIQLLSPRAGIKTRMLYSSSTLGLKRSIGVANFDCGLFVEEPAALTFAAYLASRDFREETDAQVLTEQERLRREERAHVDQEQTDQAATATGRVLATAAIHFKYDDDLEQLLHEPQGQGVVFAVNSEERFYLLETCDPAPETLAEVAGRHQACFIVAPGARDQSFFIYYVSTECPMRDRVMMSSAKGSVKDHLKELGYGLVAFEAGTPDDIATRIAETTDGPRPLIEQADTRARPRPQKRR